MLLTQCRVCGASLTHNGVRGENRLGFLLSFSCSNLPTQFVEENFCVLSLFWCYKVEW